MTRVNVTDSETGEYRGWFDMSTALAFSEDTYWDGHNHISKATGSQWHHETVYYTRTGKWILEWSSQYQGAVDRINELSENQAFVWLLSQRCLSDENFEKLPAAIQARIEQANAEREL